MDWFRRTPGITTGDNINSHIISILNAPFHSMSDGRRREDDGELLTYLPNMAEKRKNEKSNKNIR